MKRTFQWYLHEDGSKNEVVEELMDQGLTEEVATEIAQSRPFYEVTLECSYDDVHKILTYQAYGQERLTSA